MFLLAVCCDNTRNGISHFRQQPLAISSKSMKKETLEISNYTNELAIQILTESYALPYVALLRIVNNRSLIAVFEALPL